MPITGWHAARMRDPGDFQKDSFVTLKIGGDKTGILLISGKLKGKTTLTEQAYRFDMDKWSVAEAKKWLKDHDKKPISFEEGVKPKKDNEPENSDNDYIGKVNLEELPEIDESELSEYADITQDLDVNNEEDTEKQLPSNIEYKTFHLNLTEVKKLCINDDEKGVFIGAMASQAKDLGNDIIAPNAFDETLSEYRKNKQNIQLYYNHQTLSDLPIGIISFKNVEQDGKNWNVKGELNLDTQRGAEVYSLMKQGALTDLSIGYYATDVDYKGKNRILNVVKLSEVSVVGKGMNPKAKVEGVKQLYIDCKAIIPFQDYPILKKDGKPNTDYKWDGSAAEMRVRKFTDAEDAPNSRYKKAHMWYDPDNQDKFSGYKLLYVDVVDDNLQVIPRAIFEKAALLHGGRAGLNISDADKKTLASHVNKYYDKMGLESPLKNKNIEYLFTIDNELKTITKFEIADVESISSKAELNETLRKSGVFSNAASEYLASCFNIKQSKSVNGDFNELKSALIEIKKILEKL